jgi:hypothetical protein
MIKKAQELSLSKAIQPQEEEKTEEQPKPVEAKTTAAPQEMITVITPGLSEAESRKLEELRAMKAQNKLKKKEAAEKPQEKQSLSTKKADALPPVMQRKGQWEMIPEFLKQKGVLKDMNTIQEGDIMADAFKKQDNTNNDGLSMSEMFAQKRKQTEKALEEKKSNVPSGSEVEERKARLLA